MNRPFKTALASTVALAALLGLTACDRQKAATSTPVTPDTSQSTPAATTSSSTVQPVAPDSPRDAGGTGAPVGGALQPNTSVGAATGTSGSGVPANTATPEAPNATTGLPVPPTAPAGTSGQAPANR